MILIVRKPFAKMRGNLKWNKAKNDIVCGFRGEVDSVHKSIKSWLLGEKLASNQIHEEKFTVFWGLPVLASDAISSVAYAAEEILWAFVPVIGVASYFWLPKVAGAIVILLVLLTISYRQIVEAYPNGGGAYIVAKDNLKTIFGLIVGASLSVDYTLTVAVSISAATAAITSAIPFLFTHKVAIAIMLILLIAFGNLRGVKDSSKIFSIPTYAFMMAIIILIFMGLVKTFQGSFAPHPDLMSPDLSFGTQAISLFLILKAFSSGCAAVTGVEAICDAVPNFKEPAPQNAKNAYILLAIAVFITFAGTSYLAQVFQAVPNEKQTVIAQLAIQVFGKGFMFYLIQATTAIILAMAANTAFVGFPTLISVISRDGYAPRQLASRGHRLNYSNGILLLALAAALLVIIFQGDTHALIPLYAVGVFTSFTLAQAGMCRRWWRLKPKGWHYKAFINGLGCLVTFVAVLVIGVTKFISGAWIVFIIIPILIYGMYRIKNHYKTVAGQLDIPNAVLQQLKLKARQVPYVIIPIDSLNKMVIKSLNYAQSISPNVEVFHVETYEGEADKLRKKWRMLDTDIPLVIKQSPYREVIKSLVEHIESEEHSSQPGDIITILLPQFVVSKPWQMALHNNTSLFITNALLKERDIVVSILPFQVEDDSEPDGPVQNGETKQ
ncbi:APC family permease [Candidatus Formimonas warabiya]|uniref:APC family permease n=1 Tax=Formimonas warabiya TaxID=1761012 RepID=UPI001F29D9A0|nr:APC family permease [Candidatus Formimonas warabiya]